MTAEMRVRIRAGDNDAFGELFDEHADAIHRHAVWSGGDLAQAEDVVSLTFLEAWRIRESLHPDGDSLRPWLLGIATNVLRNLRRHREALRRLPVRDTVPDFAEEVVAMFNSNFAAVADTATWSQAAATGRSLPKPDLGASAVTGAQRAGHI